MEHSSQFDALSSSGKERSVDVIVGIYELK